ncbi:molybdenum-dependent transcriptional regulator [Erwinia sp. OLTSP20]|uniref:molybdenum-dependent transcriptional regulator n=1 Tax=unclassified Erwinia TaxID=2622719 RepID=UPI000C1746EE|nr:MULTISPECIES: molybdenum-dependent transcriptional regulator [unclassified Erwinia]PIJ48735.1 molybdenum-dependent transcriptional regulator [Erwinia sp. OAMSP11]PIJ69360.1 molybdenum-dependent transcriptional regulator [Erwinia sp. OLSSP12]PIJ79194.1 molybdenum-dependent transcriptional regulator [Erwinia sp. OLCASP19]PIJ80720.1 molybdenum-dependent transcriptional regulator [Erwinia sp. OLMTSP26]PIJ82870.1 molybdenum-dependent transcriptional regulator [Erwinia sp. OLMDSP33]
MQSELSLIIKMQQRLFADARRIELLRQIKATGSISQGAKLAAISYKSAWDAVNEMNQLADQPLVDRATGGKGGGGAALTAWGERLIELFDLLEQIQQKAFDVLQDDQVPLDSLLGAIARFSLQTSARNQLSGTVIGRDQQHVRQHIQVLLADGVTRLTIAVTETSARRLQLENGKQVLVLIKAPWIALDAETIPAENRLEGRIHSIEHSPEYSEILIDLPDGQQLCASLNRQTLRQKNLQTGDRVTAHFNADQAIIATLL